MGSISYYEEEDSLDKVPDANQDIEDDDDEIQQGGLFMPVIPF